MSPKINCLKAFHYEVAGNIENPTKVLFVLHGYGQLTRFFIRKFQSLNKDWLIIAPEGMHRFYLEGSSGRVGASWMTKENREDDISDNINWLDQLFFKIKSEHPSLSSFHLLGFSQGGATAARWASTKDYFKSIILWACVFPPDLNQNIELENISSKHFVLGSEDQYYNEEQQKDLINYYQSKKFATHLYTGDHNIDSEILSKVIQSLNI